MIDLENTKEELQNGGYTCVLCHGEKKVYSAERGVKPLIKLLQSGEDFSRFSAADKVVGKATAFLYCLLGVKAVYAFVVSRAALDILREHQITIQYITLTEAILNHRKDGFCPMEADTKQISDPRQALAAIRQTLKALRGGQL